MSSDLMYDAVIIGAGISGSVSAKMLAESGYKVLLVDKATPPRDKVCSGVQLKYLEKLIGEKIPREVLCSNNLNRVRITLPSGRYLEGNMSLLNFWRKDFDYWLNRLAIDAGADTCWGAKVSDYNAENDSASITINSESIETKYIIGADGLSPSSFMRKVLFPGNFSKELTGSSINLFYSGSSMVKQDTLYLYFRKRLSDIMYSWLYYKNDLLIIGTSSTEKLGHYAEAFVETVKNNFELNGYEVGREGFSTHCKGGVLLGRDRVLLIGDAAGFLDLYRGVGMDAAALSGRLGALSIIDSLGGKGTVQKNYMIRTRELVSMINNNVLKQEARYKSDRALENSFAYRKIIKGRLAMIWANIWNHMCKPEKIKLLPP
jgi:flavin-dependent dehydrogenase